MIKTGFSINFVDAFNQYKEESKLNFVNILIRGNNRSIDFLNTENISVESRDGSSYIKLTKHGGLYSLLKIYNPIDYALLSRRTSNQIVTTYNFSPHLQKAISRKVAKQDKYDIELENDFFSPLNDSLSNEIIFGSKSRYGYLLDIDNDTRMARKTSYENNYQIDTAMNKMFIEVDSISSSQSERSSSKGNFGFYVINNPGYYISSLGLRGIRVEVVRQSDIPGNILVL